MPVIHSVGKDRIDGGANRIQLGQPRAARQRPEVDEGLYIEITPWRDLLGAAQPWTRNHDIGDGHDALYQSASEGVSDRRADLSGAGVRGSVGGVRVVGVGRGGWVG